MTTKEDLYRIVDVFLVEAKDQNGNDRSVERLNTDRHLAVEALSEVIKKAVEEERATNNETVKVLFSGKKIVRSEHLPHDEIWIGTGPTRSEKLDMGIIGEPPTLSDNK